MGYMYVRGTPFLVPWTFPPMINASCLLARLQEQLQNFMDALLVWGILGGWHVFFVCWNRGKNGILQKWWDLVEVAYFFLWNQGKRPYICMCPWKNVCCNCKSYTLVTVTIYRAIGLVDIPEELHVCKHQTRIFGNSCFFNEYGLAFIPLGLTLWSRKSFRGHGDFLYSRFETYMMNLRTFGKALQGNSS